MDNLSFNRNYYQLIRNRWARLGLSVALAVLTLVAWLAGLFAFSARTPVVLAQQNEPVLLITKTLDTSQLVSGGATVIIFTMTGAGDPLVITHPLDVMLVMDTSRSMERQASANPISDTFATPNTWETVYTFTAVYTISDIMQFDHTADPAHLVRVQYQPSGAYFPSATGANTITVSSPISAGTWLVQVKRNSGAQNFNLDMFIPNSRLHGAIYAAKLFMDDVAAGDQVGVAVFSDTAHLRQPLTSTKSAVFSTLDGLETGLYTYMAGGIIEGHQALTTSQTLSGSVRAIVLMSDGQANCYAPGPGIPPCDTDISLSKKVAITEATNAAADGIILYTIGFGQEADQSTLQTIADISLQYTGNGKFFFAPNGETLQDVYRQIAIELNTTAASFVRITDILPGGVMIDTANLPPGPPTWVIVHNPDGSTTARLDIAEAIQISETAVYTLPIMVDWEPGMSGTVNLPGSGITYTNYQDVVTQTLFVNTPSGNPAVDPIAGLDVFKTGPTLSAPGRLLTYTLYYSNPGTAPISEAVLLDLLPPFATAIDAPNGGITTTDAVTWNLGTVISGAFGSRTVTVRLSTGITQETSLTNTARISGAAPGGMPIKTITSTWTTAISVPRLNFSIFGPAGNVQVGDRLTYTFVITNFGSADATAVTLAALLDGRLNVAFATSGYSLNNGTITWDAGSIPVGQTVTYTLVVIPGPVSAGGVLSSTGWVNSLEGASGSGPFTATLQAPVLNLTLAAAPRPVQAGGTLTYTLTAVNVGDAVAGGVTLTDTLDSDVNLLDADGGQVAGRTITWDAGAIGVGQTVTRTVLVTASHVPSGTKLNNRASIAAAQGTADSAKTRVKVINPIFLAPILELSKLASKDPVFVGDTLVYTIILTNSGSAQATGVAVTDILDSRVAFVSADGGGVHNAGQVTWSNDVLAAGQTVLKTIVVTVRPVADGTVLNNTAWVTSAQGTGDSDAIATTLLAPNLQLTKTAAPNPVQAGGTLTYTLLITNRGTAAASGVVITDTLDGNVSVVSATHNGGTVNLNTLIWNVGSVAAGHTISRAVVVQVGNVPSATVLVNSASVAAAQGTTGSDSVQTTVLNPAFLAPIFSIAKSDYPDPVQGGNLLTYTITVTNTGSADAAGVIITDTPDGRVGIVSAGQNGSLGLGVVTWTVGPLAIGQPATRTLVVTVGNEFSGTLLTNNASVGAANGAPNAATAQTTVYGLPALTLVKSASPDPVAVGGRLTYTIVARNTGTARANGLVITDALPGGLAFAGASGSYVYRAGVVTWNVGGLNVGATITRTLAATVGAVASGTRLSNVAGAAWAGGATGSNAAGSSVIISDWFIYLPIVLKVAP
ncbi:MAG: VWA domain-containing protein [Anaerolineae bacterium]